MIPRNSFFIDAEDEDELLNEKSPEEDECDDNDDDDDSPVLGSALTPPDSPPFQDVRMTKKSATVWKYHKFSIAQNLREINFWDSKSAKYAIITHLEALDLDLYEFLQFLKD